MPYCGGGGGGGGDNNNTSIAFIVLGMSGVTYRCLWCYK
jgi:hypothetical protein